MWFAPKSMRVWFAFMGAMLWLSIFLTGFSTVHWFTYVPAISLVFSAATGLCLPLAAAFKLFGVHIEEVSNQPAN
jgi:hypothetical protein